jgi:hypothetical protein
MSSARKRGSSATPRRQEQSAGQLSVNEEGHPYKLLTEMGRKAGALLISFTLLTAKFLWRVVSATVWAIYQQIKRALFPLRSTAPASERVSTPVMPTNAAIINPRPGAWQRPDQQATKAGIFFAISLGLLSYSTSVLWMLRSVWIFSPWYCSTSPTARMSISLSYDEQGGHDST